MELSSWINEDGTGDSAAATHQHDEAQISSRIECLPLTRWHTRVLGIVGLVHMTDAFDALTIAFVMPVLINLWHLTPAQAGMMVAGGYAGQTLGALSFSAAAERFGRLRVLRWLLVILALGSLASAYAPSYGIFIALRLLQGIGLGGESPVSATYMNEVCPARIRGRLIFILQSTFAVGNLVAAVAAVWLIPTYGWQAMFLLGGLPILLAAILPYTAPESPRWLAINGRVDEAKKIVERMERAVPHAQRVALRAQPVTAAPVYEKQGRFSALFARGFAKRTVVVWSMACCASLMLYGILVWLPSLYRTVYHVPLQVALRYGTISMVASLAGTIAGIFVVDWLGRKKTFALAFLGAALPMVYLAWQGLTTSAGDVLLCASISVAMIVIVQCGIYVYAPEVYPTRIRASGAGAASAITRIASVAGPLIIGQLLTHLNVQAVFGYFAGVSLLGAFVIAAFAMETRGRTLDEIAV